MLFYDLVLDRRVNEWQRSRYILAEHGTEESIVELHWEVNVNTLNGLSAHLFQGIIKQASNLH